MLGWKRSFGVVVCVPLLLLSAARAGAQLSPDRLFQPHMLTLTASFGGAAFSPFLQSEARANSGPVGGQMLDRRVSAQTSIAFSGAATYWLSRYWGVRLHASWSPTRFKLVLHDELGTVQPPSSGAELAPLSVWLYDLDGLFRLPVTLGQVAPYGIVGAGRVGYHAKGSLDAVPAEARRAFAGGSTTSWAAVIGLGAVIPLERRDLFLNFEATNHFARTPLDYATRGLAEEAGLMAELDPDHMRRDPGRITSTIRVSVGLTLPLRIPR